MSNFNYNVDYELDGISETQRVEAANPGEAFAKCLKLLPAAKLIKCWIYGKIGDTAWQQEWEPPPVAREIKPDPRPPRPLKLENYDCVLPFYDEVKSYKP